MKKDAKENGITLVALVVTIIVLLILAGVSLSLVLGDNGIITRAQDAVKKNDEATAREKVAMAWAGVVTDGLATGEIKGENLNKYLTDSKGAYYDDGDGKGTIVYDGFVFNVDESGHVELVCQLNKETELFMDAALSGKVEIGDYVKYTPDPSDEWMSRISKNGYKDQVIEQEELNWRVFSIDYRSGEILLISETPTMRGLGLKGSVGWLFGVDELNDICRSLYSGRLGSARSLNSDDISRIYDGLREVRTEIVCKRHVLSG